MTAHPPEPNAARVSAIAASRRFGPWIGACVVMLSGGCALQPYTPQPLQPEARQAALLDRRADDDATRAALARLGIDTRVWPLPAWDAPALSALALSTHPDLAAARAELAVADAAGATARQRVNPTLEWTVEHHSAPGTRDSPWSLGFALDTLIGDWLVGQSRSQAVAAAADAQQLEAVERLSQIAGDVYRRVIDAHRAVFDAGRRASLATETLRLQQQEGALWQRRLELGAARSIDVLEARQREGRAAAEARQAERAVLPARTALAAAVGLPHERLEALPLRFDSLARAPESVSTTNLPPLADQRGALLHSPSTRLALVRYAAADAAVRLEIARQLPELSLKPGYAWDQGDHRWSLGIGYALPLWHRNDGPIAEAMARRDAEAARFEALQAQALAALDRARSELAAAGAAEADARQQVVEADRFVAATVRRLDRGDADRLEHLVARRQALDRRAALLEADVAWADAQAALDHLVQGPLPLPQAASGTAVAAAAAGAPAGRPWAKAGERAGAER